MKQLIMAVLLCGLLFTLACQQPEAAAQEQAKTPAKCAGCPSASSCVEPAKTSAKVTFVEVGSVTCIPCKAMQPVMKAVEAEFGEQISVVFYDVKTDPTVIQKYKISLIPTQIFLDAEGKEFHRHEGFYPQAEISKLLVERGLAPKKATS